MDLLARFVRTIDAIWMDDWRIDVGYPEDCDEAERRLQASDDAAGQAITDSAE